MTFRHLDKRNGAKFVNTSYLYSSPTNIDGKWIAFCCHALVPWPELMVQLWKINDLLYFTDRS